MTNAFIIRTKPRIFGRKSRIFTPGYTPKNFMLLLTQDGRALTAQNGKILITQQRAH